MGTSIKLSQRLLAVASMAAKGNSVCDVGCDHGFTAIYLVKNSISPRVIAMDIHQGPLHAAKQHIAEYHLAAYIETRLSDGVEQLNEGEADTLVCAGMGGGVMQHILEEGKGKIRFMQELILQPQSKLEELRRYLRQEGYLITDEEMVWEDGKFYPIIKAVPGARETESYLMEEQQRRTEDLFGPVLLRKRNPVLHRFLLREMDICKNILEKMQASRQEAELTKQVKERIALIKRALTVYEE